MPLKIFYQNCKILWISIKELDFTVPNNDWKNDFFRPLIFGKVKSYKFIIYNRWGQIVLQSTEFNKGSDGTVRGINQDENVYVWTCGYQLEGEKEEYKKGTVLLTR